MRQNHRRNKQAAVEYKGGRCEVCGYAKSLAALEFHHKDPAKKDFQISGQRVSWDTKRQELDKCSLLCANCHREEHERLTDLRHAELLKKVRQKIPEKSTPSKVKKTCPTCKQTFTSYAYAGQVFCKKICKTQVKWPTLIELKEALKTRGPSALAIEIGVHSKSVRQHLKKNGIDWRNLRV